jgi:hypothetical protein
MKKTYVQIRLAELDLQLMNDKSISNIQRQKLTQERLGLMGEKSREELSLKEFQLLDFDMKKEYLNKLLLIDEKELSGTQDHILRFYASHGARNHNQDYSKVRDVKRKLKDAEIITKISLTLPKGWYDFLLAHTVSETMQEYNKQIPDGLTLEYLDNLTQLKTK